MKNVVLAIASVSLSAALVQAQSTATYAWVDASAPPLNVVTAPDGIKSAVCKGVARDGKHWVGYWDQKICVGSLHGQRMEATSNLSFLTVRSGVQSWIRGGPGPGDVNAVPSSAIVAWKGRNSDPQLLCAKGGYIGWVDHASCSFATPVSGRYADVLTGSMHATPEYAWVRIDVPPANSVTAPDESRKVVCKGLGVSNRLWAGWWDGKNCVGSSSGAAMRADHGLQFLTVMAGEQEWVAGTNKRVAVDVGTIPANTINAGNTYIGKPQLLCSIGGFVGWANGNYCEIWAPSVLNATQNSKVLVGTLRP